MRYHVLQLGDDRPEPRYFSVLDATDDDDARRLVAEKWGEFPELRLQLVRQDGDKLVPVQL
jgi:hypothetical protein